MLFAVMLLCAAAFAYVRLGGPLGSSPDGPPAAPDIVRVNQSAQSIYFGDLSPEPSVGDLSFRLYGPGMGHGDRGASSAGPVNGTYLMEDVLPTVDLLFRDLNNDSAVSKGEYLTVQDTDGPLATGIWHLEMSYPGHAAGNVTFTFRVLPEGTSYQENVRVDFIDVGQGDAELITTSDGKVVLIDAGTRSYSTLLSYLQGRSVTALDAFILTHPDADHIGGADEVLEQLEVRSVYHPGVPLPAQNTTTYRDFLAAAQAEGCPIFTDEDLDPGDYLNISVTEDFRLLTINAAADDTNDASIVVRMTAESRSFLFTGDIGAEVEAWLVEHYSYDLDVDVLKAAHHGSRYSSSDEFLNAVTPDIAIIEVGAGNSYGHPHAEAVDRLTAHGATIVRTDLAGTYVITVAGAVIS